MALPANVVSYVNRKKEALERQGIGTASTVESDMLRGYVGIGERISGEEADKRIMRMMNEW
ncbi:MAG: hypothetical protein LBH25_14465 [Fibromonadaceae bacterium]|jgi:hypothetical protein|nr:hypothetical protein [Fibromonadaceae bacterium]